MFLYNTNITASDDFHGVKIYVKKRLKKIFGPICIEIWQSSLVSEQHVSRIFLYGTCHAISTSLFGMTFTVFVSNLYTRGVGNCTCWSQWFKSTLYLLLVSKSLNGFWRCTATKNTSTSDFGLSRNASHLVPMWTFLKLQQQIYISTVSCF